MVTYVKNTCEFGMYIDQDTKKVIRRGQIVAFDKLSTKMKARIRAGGLAVVSENDYKTWLSAKEAKLNLPKEIMEAPASSFKEEVVEEQPKLSVGKKKKSNEELSD